MDIDRGFCKLFQNETSCSDIDQFLTFGFLVVSGVKSCLAPDTVRTYCIFMDQVDIEGLGMCYLACSFLYPIYDNFSAFKHR